MKKYTAGSTYKSPYPNPILFKKGDEVKIIKEFTEDPDWEDWLWCEGANNNAAWTPKQFIDRSGETGIINCDYNAMELSVEPGEIVIISKIVNGFGIGEKEDGTKSWITMKILYQE